MIVTVFIVPVVLITAVAVAFWKGSVVTSIGCCPPTYPVPAPSILTVPILFFRTTKDLVENLDSYDDPKTLLPWNPPIIRPQ